jgi:NAD(P)-dependent dehydrogenase (short-subunit alcohol dehydrogenase family)
MSRATGAVLPRAVREPLSLFQVAGRSMLITGATGALGRVAALSLAAAGARLTLAAGNAERLEAVGKQVGELGGTAVLVNRRPEEAADADAMVAAAVDAFGRVDAVVTASGLNKVAPIVEQDPADWDEVMRANVRGSWLVCRAAGRQMLDQGGGGKVVLVSSTRGKLGHPAGYAAYCPSKAAVDLLCKTLACEWGPQRITVNAIAPTVFRSDLTAWMYAEEGRGRQVREAMLGRIPLGRLGEPEDFVGALIYLLSPASDFCTGHVLYVDGGYTAG